MKAKESWEPSKYIYKNNKLIASRDRKQVGPGTRLIADLVAQIYDENLQKYAKGKLLDLGCGTVPFYIAYKNYVTENVCVDWENTLHHNVYLDYECDLTQRLPFADGEFDTIILSDVLEHIPEPALLWDEISRILAADGKLLMNVPFFYWLHEQPHDYYRYTEYALRRFVVNADLNLVHLEVIGGVPEIVTDIWAKNVLRIPFLGVPLAILAQWFTAFFIKTRLGAEVSKRTAKNFPFGYFLVVEKPK
jgi:SAM-dependent methyltransferase